ncbi:MULTISPECIES: GNAT family N-acetyltransferase [Microbulbifer]|nr:MULTISPECIES: GNAT family N-acetyltransferase [Microbulbifer]KUJ82590.1 hypothetical protein AVO43_12415 [Microbulbifer sp. ZGT114]
MEASIARERAGYPDKHISGQDQVMPELGEDVESARRLLDAWALVQPDSEPCSVDAHPDFYLPFLNAREGKNSPQVVLWRQGSDARGILVGRRSRGRHQLSIGPLKIPMPELRRLDITYGGLESKDEQVAQLQADYLRELLQSGTVDCISVHHLPVDSAIGGILQAGLRMPGDGSPIVKKQWFLQLTDDQKQPIVTNSAKTRSSQRRQDRKLEKAFSGTVKIREVRDLDQVGRFIEAASEIGAKSYQGSLRIGVTDSRRWHTHLGVLAGIGCLRAYVLEAQDTPIAYAVGSYKHRTYTGIATSFLPEHRNLSPGAYLNRRVIEHLQAEGAMWLDFGFGDASYKQLHGTWQREIVTLHLYSRTPAARVARALDASVKWVDHTSRRMLHESGLYERARKLIRRSAERNR